MKIKAKKGCVNQECIMCKKKKHIHKDDSFCAKCGNSLSFVCEKCHTVLEDGTSKLCISCQAKKDDNTERRKGGLSKAGAIIAPVIGAVALFIKKE